MAGEEVVQLYVSHQQQNIKAPVRALKGFQRIKLNAGESKLVTFTLRPEDLSLVNETTGASYQPKGKIQLSIGGGQPGTNQKMSSNILNKSIQVL